MCGGLGTRLDASVEKPLVEVCGRPMFDRVVDALRQSRIDQIHAVVSPHTPDTRAHAKMRDIAVIDAPGEGYVADLGFALERVSRPVLTVVSDLPLLEPSHVNDLIDDAAGATRTACVPVSLKRSLGASVDDLVVFEHRGREVCPTGLGIVGAEAADRTDSEERTDSTNTATSDSTVYLTADPKLALNVNRQTDIALAEDRCE
ncbi:NTP transferase domain-containing protein [Haloferax larsenii]|uniref:NTP transferase domain-containing protein n=1 Tax=Haloferax larsenii TaxID=302484 RepID=A0ABY5RJW6_HALLR|nr:NTP transferase domain-containing protein [Haloferax larsenii]ELZ74831.1 4-diphosphocytidyl-2C-methyl-D-erythritol synthase [Haloferax larsenii JCM 13917]UVE51855.1 NTP transferase domain-containing protein [Haloferax larsenii]